MKINIVGFFEKAYSYLPKLSPQIKEFIVRVLPPISIVFGLLIALSSILELLGTPVISLFSSKSTLPVIQILLITNVLGVFQGLLMIFAFSGLKKKHEKAWRYLVWSQILWIVGSLLTLSTSVIFALIILYPLFGVKEEYK